MMIRVVAVRTAVSLLALGAILPFCRRSTATEAEDIATLHLTCAPTSRGVQCHLYALSRDVGRAPRDVTTDASWRLAGITGAQISTDGVITAPSEGDLELDASYHTQQTRAWARLTPNGPGHMLAVVQGRVYIEQSGTVQPVVAARVEIVSGSHAGVAVMTGADGRYELVGFMPDEVVVVRATKLGCTSVEKATQISFDVNQLSLVIEPLPPTGASTL